MKGNLVGLAFVLSLPVFAVAQPAELETEASAATSLGTPVKGPGGKKGGAPAASTTLTLTPSFPSSTPSSSTTSSSQSATFSTTTNTIEISSFMTSPWSISSPSNSASTPAAMPASLDSSSNSTASASSSPQSSNDHRTLILVLSSVLGFVGLLLIAAALFLAYRFGQGRTPFGHRSATPLDDDEIESWRGTVIEQKEHLPAVDPAMPNRHGNSIQLQSPPGWTWTASPTSARSAPSPFTTSPNTPAFLAKAPNSRVGLTDETIPGADPFIPPVKRQSSRLSKPPPGHVRSKSRRSSTSAKSVWSYNGGIGPNSVSDKLPMWFDPDDHAVGKALGHMERSTSNSPATSIFESVVGGLSPRPKSRARPWEGDMGIGRAIA